MKQINLEQLKEMLNALEEVFAELDIDFYMIGAIAKDYWYKQGNKRMRHTKDVDFAIMVSSEETYSAVREGLKNHHFVNTRENAFVMISPQGIQVDLLPFGDIAIDEGVKIAGQGMTSIKVNGFMEVYQAGTAEIMIETGHVFKTATLPAIVLLKLIAYDDRPEKRLKDAGDIASIINNYFDLQHDLIYENHNDLFADDKLERELQEIAATVIGREIKKMCENNLQLKNRLINVIANLIEKEHTSAFVKQMVGETTLTVKEMINWLKAVLSGLTEN